jgi:hydrogenase maturation protease
MNRPLVDQIADAVLYEGYLLYPYRPSVKNRQRWTFGGLYPRSYSEAQAGTDPWMSQTECLVSSRGDVRLSLRVRFLHLQLRRVEGIELGPGGNLAPGAPTAWQEAVERDVQLGEHALAELVGRGDAREFAFPARRAQEPTSAREEGTGGTVIREQYAIAGSVELSAERPAESLYKVTVRVRNDTPFSDASRGDRDEALLHALVSTHAILGVRDGEFVSMIDPPEPWREIAAGCRNIGTWPVLVGEPGARDTMLSAPIILYDYPQVAPESPGDLFDATEIDEILTLRVLTLTEDEKRAMCDVDDRARALLERTESLAREQLMGLHGTIRGLRPI